MWLAPDRVKPDRQFGPSSRTVEPDRVEADALRRRSAGANLAIAGWRGSPHTGLAVLQLDEVNDRFGAADDVRMLVDLVDLDLGRLARAAV